MITSQSNIFFSLILSYGIDECISKVSLQSQFKNYCIWLQFKIFKKLILSHNLQGNMSTFSYTCFAGKEQLLCNFLEKLLGELKKKKESRRKWLQMPGLHVYVSSAAPLPTFLMKAECSHTALSHAGSNCCTDVISFGWCGSTLRAILSLDTPAHMYLDST